MFKHKLISSTLFFIHKSMIITMTSANVKKNLSIKKKIS